MFLHHLKRVRSHYLDMGIFSRYGLEYRAVFADGTYHIIIPLECLDTRLLNSDYYRRRKSFYDKNACKTQWSERADQVDISLTEEELDDVQNLVARMDVLYHDFFDVGYMDTTHDTLQ